tara:strand:- start:377 stop:997 length:621 start_codon:yes stop_codon:yes gene_type:complete
MIKHIFLDHSGGFYFYRVHKDKLKGCDKRLKEFLHAMFNECPHDYFQEGPRSSSLKFNLDGVELKEVSGHEVCWLAEHGLMVNGERFKDNHSKVQVFMLENDDKTIAMEVPIWLEENELSNFKELFETDIPLSGHIDLVRFEDGKIWIWDYKPNAKREKYASTQVAFYAYMLSKRSGVPLEEFRCGYFDKDDAFVFEPLDVLNKLS